MPRELRELIRKACQCSLFPRITACRPLAIPATADIGEGAAELCLPGLTGAARWRDSSAAAGCQDIICRSRDAVKAELRTRTFSQSAAFLQTRYTFPECPGRS